MESFIAWLQSLVRSFKIFVIVQPWERALRVRCGKHERVLEPGFYWRLPILDAVTILAVRVRAVNLCTQTVTNADGNAVTLGVALRFGVADVRRICTNVHHPEQTITALIQGALGERVRELPDNRLSPEEIRTGLSSTIAELEGMGFGSIGVMVTDLATVRTFRLIQDGRWNNSETVDKMGREA